MKTEQKITVITSINSDLSRHKIWHIKLFERGGKNK
jgi:hypothetical protein